MKKFLIASVAILGLFAFAGRSEANVIRSGFAAVGVGHPIVPVGAFRGAFLRQRVLVAPQVLIAPQIVQPSFVQQSSFGAAIDPCMGGAVGANFAGAAFGGYGAGAGLAAPAVGFAAVNPYGVGAGFGFNTFGFNGVGVGVGFNRFGFAGARAGFVGGRRLVAPRGLVAPRLAAPRRFR